MMKKMICLGVMCLGMLVMVQATSVNAAENVSKTTMPSAQQIPLMITRVFELESHAVNHDELQAWIDKQDAKGNWPDIDYANKRRSQWLPTMHTDRLRKMGLAWRNMQANDPMRDALCMAILRGLRSWLDMKLLSPNWWHNQIGVPEQLGITALAIGDQLPAEMKAELIALLKKHVKIGMTGANKVWLARNVILRGLLEGNMADIKAGFKSIEEEIFVSDKEGIQPDYSFHQHGPILMSNSYGKSYLMVNLQYMIIATGTDAAFSDQSKAIITNMALDGTGWMCFNGQNDPASMGRSSSRKTGLRSNMRYVFEQLLKCDPPRREQVLAAIASSAGKAPMPAGNRMFWSSCLMVHQLPDWHLSIKMFSPRVYNSDGPVNTEGLENGYMSHGTAFLTRHGDEYIGLGGAWDWQHLPGSTVALSPTYQGKLKQFNGSDFAGGASDGQLGVAGFELESQGLHARLAWFCFEQGYVVLGSDLRDAANLPIVTTYDQCYRKGPVWTGHKDGSRTQLDDQTSGALSDTTWLWHDKVLYINQGNSTVLLGPLKQKGNWGRINIMYRGEPDVSADVFKAWLQHTDGQFAYTVFPQASLEQVDELVATLPMHIVAHDAKTLAIYNSVDHVGQAIFFAPGKVTFADKLTVAVDQPLAVMVRHTTDATVISLASPSQQTGKTTVTINGVSRTFDLPHGLQKGSTVTVSFK